MSAPNPDRSAMCQNSGWLVPPGEARVDRAWVTGAPHAGCTHLMCSQCGRQVLVFDRALLASRPSDWLAAYDAGRLPSHLGHGATEDAFSLYICGCRAFPVGREREVAELQLDDDLPWSCAGHPAA